MIRVQSEDFDVGQELSRLHDRGKAVGGICAFVGLVRDFADDRTVESITIEHYPGMTEKALLKIEREARHRWPLEELFIIHRFGCLAAGERIVFVATASAHRDAAFESCRFLIDWLKTKAPFWKQENGPDGTRWVEARAEDDEAAGRWNADGHDV